jgi:hypothetical protein
MQEITRAEAPGGPRPLGVPGPWWAQERANKNDILKKYIYIIIKEIYYVSIIYFNITYQGYLALTLRGPEPAGFLFN